MEAGATAPHLGLTEAESKYEKVSQVSVLFWVRVQRLLSVVLACAVLYLGFQSGWFQRAPVVKAPRPDLSAAAFLQAEPAAPPAVVIEEGGVPHEGGEREGGGAAAPASLPHVEEAPEPPPTWSSQPPDTCDGFFGNGYAQSFTVVGGGAGAGAGAGASPTPALECRYNPSLTAAFCVGQGVVVHSDRIKVSQGGEKVEDVMGRGEGEEVPVFSPGAVQVVEGGLEGIKVGGGSEKWGEGEGTDFSKTTLPGLLDPDSHKRDMLANTRRLALGGAGVGSCGVHVKDTVIMLTRMEYANLFHTSTDWYNVWSVARILGLEPVSGAALEGMMATAKEGGLTPTTLVTPYPFTPKIPAHVVFLDGHNAGPMDEGWLGLFVSISYIKHFAGAACFDRAVFAPFGYQSALSMGIIPRQHDCHKSGHVRQFGDDMVRGLALTPRTRSTCGDPIPKTLFVRRVHYLAHPRHNGKVVRRLENEDDIWEALKAQAMGGEAGVEMVNGLFSSLSMRDQVDQAQKACVIVGAHGAGLTHILFAPPEVHVLEIQTPSFGRPHFIGYTYWAGSHHHVWSLGTSTPDVHQVVTRVFETAAHASIEGKEDSHHDGGGASADHPGHNE